LAGSGLTAGGKKGMSSPAEPPEPPSLSAVKSNKLFRHPKALDNSLLSKVSKRLSEFGSLPTSGIGSSDLNFGLWFLPFPRCEGGGEGCKNSPPMAPGGVGNDGIRQARDTLQENSDYLDFRF